MANCYNCTVFLNNENESEEHIIPNACGGRLKSKELLCENCNSIFGRFFDSELAKQTNTLMNLLFIKRQRGEVQPILTRRVSDDETIVIQADGTPKLSKPKISLTKKGEKTILSIAGRDAKEQNKIFKGFKEKYPQIDSFEFKRNTIMKEDSLGKIRFDTEYGGIKLLKSIAKIAINFYIYKNGDRSQIAHLLEFLNDQDDKININIACLHYPSVEIYKPIGFEVKHLIHLVGDPKEKILYAYIELFNALNFIVKLSETYCGLKFSTTYSFDLFNTTEVEKEISLSYTKSLLNDFILIKDKINFNSFENKMRRVHVIAHMLQIINNIIKKYPKSSILTKDMLDECCIGLAKHLKYHDGLIITKEMLEASCKALAKNLGRSVEVG